MVRKKAEKINAVSISMNNVNLWTLILKKSKFFFPMFPVSSHDRKVNERVTGLDPAV